MEEDVQAKKIVQHISPLPMELEPDNEGLQSVVEEAARQTEGGPLAVPSSMRQHNQAQHVESTLFVLQDVLWNLLVHFRNHGTLQASYEMAKHRCEGHYPSILSVECIFKVLMDYPAELLSAIYVPMILRFFKWSFSVQQHSQELKWSRAIITTKRGMAFLVANFHEFSYNAATLYQASQSLKLLQSLEMALLPQKPVLGDDSEDEEAMDPTWTPLNSEQLESLIKSLTKDASTLPQVESAPVLPEIAPASISEFLPFTRPSQSPPMNMSYVTALQHQPTVYGVQQVPIPSAFSDLPEPFTTLPSGHSNESLSHQSSDKLFSQTFPNIFHRINALEVANERLTQDNDALFKDMKKLKSQLQNLEKSVENTSLQRQNVTSPKVVHAGFPSSASANVVVPSSYPMETSDLAISGVKLEGDLSSQPVNQAQQLATGYESLMPFNPGTSEFIPDTRLRGAGQFIHGETMSTISSRGGSIASTSPVGLLTTSDFHSPAKKPKPVSYNYEGAKLTKGETYHPPQAPDGKRYLLDEEGKLAIVMAPVQSSVYGVYNEYYQSLRPQVDAYAEDYGKKSIGHFRKKRTFQKKKAFVQWVERLSDLNGIPPELVLDMIDDVRVREKKSVVWACNNLGSCRTALGHYNPELKDRGLSDVE